MALNRKVWAVKHWRGRCEPDDHLRRGTRTPLQYYKRPIRGDNKAVDRQVIDAEDAAIVQRGGWELLAIRDLLLKHAGDHAHWRGYFLDRIAMRAATVRQIAEAIAPPGCPIDPKRLAKQLNMLAGPEIDVLHRVEIDQVVEYVRPEGDDTGELGPVRLVDVVGRAGPMQRQDGQDGPGGHAAAETYAAALAAGGGENAGRDPQQQTVTASAEIGGSNPRESAPVRGNTDTNADPPSAAADGGSNGNANSNADADGPEPPAGPTAADGGADGGNANSDPHSDAHGGGGPGPAAQTPAASDPATTPGSPGGEGGCGAPPRAVGVSEGDRGKPSAGGGSTPDGGGKDNAEPGDDQRTEGERLGAMLDERETLARLVTAELGIDAGPMTVRERASQVAAIAGRWSWAVELLRQAGGDDEAIGDWAAKRIAKARHLGHADGLLSQDESEAIVAKLPEGTTAAMAAAACAALRRATLQKRARIWMADTKTQAGKAADAICPVSEASA